MVLLAVGLEIALHFSNAQHGMVFTSENYSHCADASAPGWETYSVTTTDYGFMHYVYASGFSCAYNPGSSNGTLLSDIPTHRCGHDARSDGSVDRHRDQENAAIYRSGQRGFTTADESSTRLYTHEVSG